MVLETLITKDAIKKNDVIHIVPQWQDKNIYDFFHNLVVVEGSTYKPIGDVDFNYPNSIFRRLKNDASFKELHFKFDKAIISKVHELAENNNASLVFLYDKRGYGYLDISASFYARK